ncbi:hypothetical protein PMI05_04752 [Brevibacillus sp. BC25]|nr:hypothetical protein PMI05_04752 [Brevibacillus sp. BC25]
MHVQVNIIVMRLLCKTLLSKGGVKMDAIQLPVVELVRLGEREI